MAIQIASFPSPVMFKSVSSPRHRDVLRSASPMATDGIDFSVVGVLDIQRALEIARNTEGELDRSVSQYLEARVAEVWERIESDPDTYLLSKDEFAIFNYFVGRYQGSKLAEKAIARFWSSYQEVDSPMQQ